MNPSFDAAVLVQEKRLLQKYFDEINQDTGKYCFMVDDTLKGLDLGAVETLIVWDNLDIYRYFAPSTSADVSLSKVFSVVRGMTRVAVSYATMTSPGM